MEKQKSVQSFTDEIVMNSVISSFLLFSHFLSRLISLKWEKVSVQKWTKRTAGKKFAKKVHDKCSCNRIRKSFLPAKSGKWDSYQFSFWMIVVVRTYALAYRIKPKLINLGSWLKNKDYIIRVGRIYRKRHMFQNSFLEGVCSCAEIFTQKVLIVLKKLSVS